MTTKVNKALLRLTYIVIAIAVLVWLYHGNSKDLWNYLPVVIPIAMTVNIILIIVGIVINFKFLVRIIAKIPKNVKISILIISLVGLVLAVFIAPRTHRLYYDEDIYCNIAQSIAYTGKAVMANEAYYEYGEYQLGAFEMADVLKIDMNVTSKIINNRLKANVKVINNGNTDAYKLNAEIHILGKIYKGQSKAALPVKHNFATEFNIPLEIKQKGTYPFLVRLSFADANGYPFSTIASSSFNWKENTVSGVCAIIPKIDLNKTSHIKLIIKNTDNKIHKCKISYITPSEISVKPKSLYVELKPTSELHTGFDLSNNSALIGANYPIFIFCEYDEDGKHFFSKATGEINISSNEKFKRSNSSIMFYSLICFLILLALWQLKAFLPEKKKIYNPINFFGNKPELLSSYLSF